jgi:hypothetical protein
MSWSGTVDDAHKLGQRVRVVKEVMTLTDGSTGTVVGAYVRMNTITTDQWVGIQAQVAIAYVAAESTVANLEDLSAEPMNDAGAYRVIKSITVPGTWA